MLKVGVLEKSEKEGRNQRAKKEGISLGSGDTNMQVEGGYGEVLRINRNILYAEQMKRVRKASVRITEAQAHTLSEVQYIFI